MGWPAGPQIGADVLTNKGAGSSTANLDQMEPCGYERGRRRQAGECLKV